MPAIGYIKIRHLHARTWACSSKETWAEHVEYILGPPVLGMEAKDPSGKTLKSPNWVTVMHYEQQARKKAWELMNHGD